MNSVYCATSTNSATIGNDVHPIGCSHRQCQVCCCKQLVASTAKAAAGNGGLSLVWEMCDQQSNLCHGKAWAWKCSHGYHFQAHSITFKQQGFTRIFGVMVHLDQSSP